jgi:hypothetical protein
MGREDVVVFEFLLELARIRIFSPAFNAEAMTAVKRPSVTPRVTGTAWTRFLVRE